MGRRAVPGDMDAKFLDRAKRHLGPQPEARQALQQQWHLGALAVQQQAVAVRQDEEIGQPLALWRQQCRPDRAARHRQGHVVRHKALEERDPILPAHFYHASFWAVLPVVSCRELGPWRRGPQEAVESGRHEDRTGDGRFACRGG